MDHAANEVNSELSRLLTQALRHCASRGHLELLCFQFDRDYPRAATDEELTNYITEHYSRRKGEDGLWALAEMAKEMWPECKHVMALQTFLLSQALGEAKEVIVCCTPDLSNGEIKGMVRWSLRATSLEMVQLDEPGADHWALCDRWRDLDAKMQRALGCLILVGGAMGPRVECIGRTLVQWACEHACTKRLVCHLLVDEQHRAAAADHTEAISQLLGLMQTTGLEHTVDWYSNVIDLAVKLGQRMSRWFPGKGTRAL